MPLFKLWNRLIFLTFLAAHTARCCCAAHGTQQQRRETLRRFMLINDSVTVAVEIPVFLTREDVNYYRFGSIGAGYSPGVSRNRAQLNQSLTKRARLLLAWSYTS